MIKLKRYKLVLLAIAAALAISCIADFSVYRNNTYIDLQSGKIMVRKYIVGIMISENTLDTTFSQKVRELGLVDKNPDEYLWHLDSSYIFTSSTAKVMICFREPYGALTSKLFMEVELANLDLTQQKDFFNKALVALRNKDTAQLTKLSNSIAP